MLPAKLMSRPQYLLILLVAAATAICSSATLEAGESKRSAVDDHIRAASRLNALGIDTIPSPGLPIGITSYDLQHYYSQGHQVAKNPGADVVHFVWTFWDVVPTDVDEIDRFVNYSSYTISIGTLNQGFNGTTVSILEGGRAGFPRLDVDGSNCAHVALHQYPEVGLGYRTWHLEFPVEGSDSVESTQLPEPILLPEPLDVIWPDVAVEQNGGGEDVSTDVYHAIAMAEEYTVWTWPQWSDRILYWRYDEGDPTPDWAGPILIDSSRSISWVIDADDNSNRVAIAFTSDYSTDGYNGMNNVAYRESWTSGMGWLSGAELGPTNKHLATSYSNPEGPQAWLHVSIAYDHNSVLHIVWIEQRVSGSEHSAIMHWSESWPQQAPRTVAIGYYDCDATWGRDLTLSQITLGIGAGSTLCQGGLESNEDYLYVVYLKLGGETPEEAADVSQAGYANGELYLTTSRDHGMTWSPSANLTNTRTPWCHADDPQSVCASEAWATIARDVDDINIFYVRDYEAGSYQESGWTMNQVMYLRLPGGTIDAPYICPAIAPNMYVELTAVPECEYHAPPGGLNEETLLTIANLGNGALEGEISVLAGDTWLSIVGGGSYTIPPAGADLVLPVIMDAGALSTGLYSGMVRVTHNDTTRPSPVDFPINFYVVENFFCPETNILKTAMASPGVLSLQVATNGRFGAPDSRGGLFRIRDSSTTIYDATLLVAHGTQDPDTVVFHRFYERLDPGQYGYVALALADIDTSAYGTGQGYAYAAARMATSDSALGVTAEWFFPQHPDSADFVIARYTIANRTASPVADIAVGVWADLNVLAADHSEEIQDGVGNHGNYVQAQNLIYQYGYDTLGHVPSAPLNSSQRYSGGLTYIAGRDALGNPFELAMIPLRGGVGDNRDNIVSGGPSSGLLYRKIVGDPGVSVWEPPAAADSVKDAYTWLTLDCGLTLAPGEEQIYIIGIVSDTLRHDAYDYAAASFEDGLAATVAAAWEWTAANVICHCPCHADPACDGETNVLDIVHAVNVAFRGVPPTVDVNCPFEQTDADCTGVTDVLDVVRFVNVAFRGSDPATEFCDPCQP